MWGLSDRTSAQAPWHGLGLARALACPSVSADAHAGIHEASPGIRRERTVATIKAAQALPWQPCKLACPLQATHPKDAPGATLAGWERALARDRHRDPAWGMPLDMLVRDVRAMHVLTVHMDARAGFAPVIVVKALGDDGEGRSAQEEPGQIVVVSPSLCPAGSEGDRRGKGGCGNGFKHVMSFHVHAAKCRVVDVQTMRSTPHDRQFQRAVIG